MEMNVRPRCNQSQITTIFLFVSMPMVETSGNERKVSSNEVKSSQVNIPGSYFTIIARYF